MPNTQEVAVRAATEASTYQEPFDNGLSELDAGDLIIPRMNITQPTTPDINADQVGKFCVNVTGDFTDKMNVAIIKLTKSRVLFPAKYKRDNEPLCRSHNFQTPADDIKDATPMCNTCGTEPGNDRKHVCAYANWGTDNTPPQCQEVWNLLIVDTDSYMPMFFSLKSTALKPLRKIVSAISMISRAKRMAMWELQFEMTLKKEVNDSGTFYLPVFSGLVPLDKDDAINMGEIRKQLVNVDISDTAEQAAPNQAVKQEEVEEVF